jgi:hypothetical protein
MNLQINCVKVRRKLSTTQSVKSNRTPLISPVNLGEINMCLSETLTQLRLFSRSFVVAAVVFMVLFVTVQAFSGLR